jgi:hypothetical protein
VLRLERRGEHPKVKNDGILELAGKQGLDWIDDGLQVCYWEALNSAGLKIDDGLLTMGVGHEL